MAWYNDDKYSAEKKLILVKIKASLKKFYPKIKFNDEITEKTFESYLDAATKLDAPYEFVNPTENKRALSDIYIKAIYMTIKGIKTQAELDKIKIDIWTRDLIWMTLAEIKRVCKGDPKFQKYWNPAKYIEVIPDEEQIETKKEEIKKLPEPAKEEIKKIAESNKPVEQKKQEIKKIIDEEKKPDESYITDVPSTSFDKKYLLYAGAGIALLYFIMKKK